jgi:addiction module HigA family antidote
MHNPAHPGEVLREYLPEDLSVGDAAKRLGVTRQALSALLNGRAGVSAVMALRLEAALGTSAEMWLGMQTNFDLWQARKRQARKVTAEVRAKARLTTPPQAQSAHYDRRRSRIVVTLTNKLELAFPPEMAEGLAGAKPADLSVIEISPTGLGLHWPRLDADLYIPGLLEGAFGSRRWMARQLGRAASKAVTAERQAAARENGKLGGRPRKVAAA